MGRSLPPRRLTYRVVVDGDPCMHFWADDDADALAKAREIMGAGATAERFQPLKADCADCKGTGKRGRGRCRECEGEGYSWNYGACAIATGVLTRKQADAQARDEG